MPTHLTLAPTCIFALACTLAAALASPARAAEYMEKNERQMARAFSPGVITEGGRIVWLAGQTALADDQGRSIAGNFEAQARQIFHLIDQTLNKAGGGIANLVTVTVFINDPRNGDRLTEIRKEIFKDGNYPGSALITVSNFAAC
jgi:2-iminobutanoate/2-iminopropanoate deaminase